MTIPAVVALVVFPAYGAYQFWRSRRHPSVGGRLPRLDSSVREPRSMGARIGAVRVALQTKRRVRLQLSATLVGGITAAVLALFLFGEVAGGDISGLAQVLQVGPLIALLLLGWWRPGLAGALLLAAGSALAGALLLAAGSALAGAYFVESSDSTVGRGEQLLVAALFLCPPMIAGALFLVAARRGNSRLATGRTGTPGLG